MVRSATRMSRSAALLLLLALAVAGCMGYKPLIKPDRPEMIINEGEALEITCTSIDEINVYFPEDDSTFGISTSEHELVAGDEASTGVKMIFRRESTVFGDTGWYGCVDANAKVLQRGDYADPAASWIYVYVRSNISALVITTPMVAVSGFLGGEVTFPCRPTAPDLHVNLKRLFTTKVKLPDLDPKVGYKLQNLTLKDAATYACEVKQGDFHDYVQFFLQIVRQSTALPINIFFDEGEDYVVAGSTLRVKCAFTIPAEAFHDIKWTTPQETNTIDYNVERIKLPDEQIRVISELVNSNVTFDDEGTYTCTVLTNNNVSNSTERYIHVNDPEKKFIILTSHDHSRNYHVSRGQSITFLANFRAYPTPTLTWYGPSPNSAIPAVLRNEGGITFTHNKTSSTLKISSVALENHGVYFLEANNEYVLEKLYFNLTVLAPPFITFWEPPKKYPAYFPVNEPATLFCQFLGNPEPKITWFLTECLDVVSKTGCTKKKYQSDRIETLSLFEWRAILTISPAMSGWIECQGKGGEDVDSSLMDIFVTDGVTNSSFGVVEPKKPIVKGDDVEIICAASIYNQSAAEWLTENSEPLVTSDRVTVTSETTNFTHRAIMHIKQVQYEDAGIYECRAYDDDHQPSSVHYKLVVYKPNAPYFTNVNMNDSKIEISVDESHEKIRLYCFADGAPKPRVTWYKDDQPLKINPEQFIMQYDNQELIIQYLMLKDSGIYSCVAESSSGRISRWTEINVKGAGVSMIWIIIIIVLIIILTILLIYFCIKVRRERYLRKQLLEAGLMHFEEGALDCINPDLTVDDQADLLPYDRKWEFPRDKLKLGKQLGSGAFGVVMKAQARGIRADESETTVAVKMVRKNAEPAYIRALASELKIMVHLGKHLNVVNLLGACTNNIAKRELLVIVEYCHFGNLHNYLLRHRNSFIDQIDPDTGKIDPSIGKELLMRTTSIGSNRVKYAALSFSRSLNSTSDAGTTPGTETVLYCTDTQDVTGLPDGCTNSDGSQPGWRSNYRGDYKDRNLKPICTQDVLSWAFQVARGMEYLCQRKVLHGDLAARNILLAENNVVKICDFGLAKTMYKDDNYKKSGNGPVPIKWMAIESIRDHVFSTQSDIWSFGIVLWEFFTLAETPYPGMKAETQYQKLVEGYRMERPKFATDGIYRIMTQCWKAKPTLRPSFTELVDNIGDLLEEGVKQHYVELNTPFSETNTSEGKNDYLTMMSAPDHSIIAGPQHDYVNSPAMPTDLSLNSPLNESGIFSPRPNSSQDNSRFEFPSSPTSTTAAHSDSEDTPMLHGTKPVPVEEDDDNYLKPINISKKREEFVRQREAERQRDQQHSSDTLADRDSGYCNTPKGLELLDIRVEAAKNRERGWDSPDSPPAILRTPDNYVNMPQQKTDLRTKDVPDSYMNPSYIFVETNRPDQGTL